MGDMTKLHEITRNDDPNIDLLSELLSAMLDDQFYHTPKNAWIHHLHNPCNKNIKGNLFEILTRRDRFCEPSGKFYFLVADDTLLGCGGVSTYYLNDQPYKLCLGRGLIHYPFRHLPIFSGILLPKMIKDFPNQQYMMSFNDHRKSLYEGFVRSNKHRRANITGDWPKIFNQFSPIGQHQIYNAIQWVVTTNHMSSS